MTAAPIGRFEQAWPALDREDLVAPPVVAALRGFAGADQVLVVDTDPDNADTAVFGEVYGVPPELSANCVVVAGRRGETTTMAACVILASTRADVNGVVRKRLNARKASFAPMDAAVSETGMEYGGITPIGLPAGWPLWIDAAVADSAWVVIGSGRRRGKILIAGKVLAQIAGAEVVPDLAN
ncbi:YbaK/EbsC family protein [Hamadaea tsunoensis]|uniref:YbaK/EbsC family protein n=1 Tax=Hamadaea tsunoensis TaxID=53368 RepID=UPI0003F8EC12|nr:YbaK/EbsC family protein [Hamadaea tsunoensis]